MPAGVPAPSILRQAVLTGLAGVTDLSIVDKGVLLFTSRHQGLFAKAANGDAVRVFVPAELSPGWGGALSVAVDADFHRNRFVYVLFTAADAGRESFRVTRLKLDQGCKSVLERKNIFAAPVAIAPTGTGAEDDVGGRVRAAPDGSLYVALADTYSPSASQSANAVGGKLLRIDREGNAVSSTHAPAGFDRRVYAYGFNEPVGIGFHPYTDRLILAERRPSASDVVHLVAPGANGGWDPSCVPPKSGYCGGASAAKRGTTVVAWRSSHGGDRLSAIEVLKGPVWRDWRNAVAAAFEGGQRIDLFKVERDGRMQTVPLLSNARAGFVAMAEGADGLYVATRGKSGGDEIWKVTPQ